MVWHPQVAALAGVAVVTAALIAGTEAPLPVPPAAAAGGVLLAAAMGAAYILSEPVRNLP